MYPVPGWFVGDEGQTVISEGRDSICVIDDDHHPWYLMVGLLVMKDGHGR